METIYWVGLILNFLGILGIIAGLWIAGRMLPAFISWLHSKYHNDLLYRPFVKILLWFALGVLFSLPLGDIIGWLRNLINVTLVPQAGGEFSTILGTVSGRVYLSFYLILMLAIYGIIVYLSKDYISTSGNLDRTGRIFIILSIASLVYRGINNIFSQVFSFQFPAINIVQNYGNFGYLIEVLVGVAILIAILIGLNRFLPNHPV